MAVMPLTPSLWPSELATYGEQQWQKFFDKAANSEFESYRAQLTQAFALSDFIFETFWRHPLVAFEWLQSGSFSTPMSANRIAELVQHAIHTMQTEDALMTALRQCRRMIQCHIIWRDVMGQASLDEVLEATSAMADEIIIQSRDWLHQSLVQKWGAPSDQEGKPQQMMIIGMGKLGGAELNVSSDVDLIFTYPKGGSTQGVRRERDNQEFFIRLGQRLIQVLNQTTHDGAVFRVDMRLRPFGDSGPLVMPFSSLEDYYHHQAREWERYAMVKARVLGPDCEPKQELEELLRPFVYRRYIDFSAFQSLRKMKLLIQQEVKRRQLTQNVKLGAGGIREVEFVVQAQQLMRGGREPELRTKNLLKTLAKIGEQGYLPAEQVEPLERAYRYLRKLEHALQGVADEQTQTLPEQAEKQTRIAAIMGNTCWQELEQELQQQRAVVHHCFDWVIGEQPGEAKESEETLKAMTLWPDIWQDELIESVCQELVAEHDREFYVALKTFYGKAHKRQIGPRGRDVLELLMPRVLGFVCSQDEPHKFLSPVLGVLETILTRTTYLELLLESPQALSQLVKFCRASRWIATELARHPMLLDELLDPSQLITPTELDAYADELRQFMLRVPEEDLEQQMEALRHFKQIQQLRIAASDVAGVLPVMKVSDHLTRLAETLLSYCIRAAWQQLSERFGTPQGFTCADECLAAIGYGKLGGFELGYGSDLDIVFFHTANLGTTTGPKVIDTSLFLAKLVQRVSHLMTTRTHSGELYEIDLRLRPSGASGVLVTHLDTLANYQKNEAWVWEHQALVRARAVFGHAQLMDAFNQLRHEILSQPRRKDELALEVVKMRHKMREHLSSSEEGGFDLKQDAGGIADIEFLAQYLVLGFAQETPEMAEWSDNVRIFETAAQQGVLTPEQVQQLTQAYIGYRNRGHQKALKCKKATVEDSEFVEERKRVQAIWQHCFATAERYLAQPNN